MSSLAWPVVAATEMRLLLRDKLATIMGIVSPLLFGALFYLIGDGAEPDDAGNLAALHLVLVLAFTAYVTATMTLAARRQHLYLKRLRSSPASTAGIVAGLVAPLLAVMLVQVVVLWGANGAMAGVAPQRWPLLLLVPPLGALICVPLAFLTAAFTRSSEAAQLTTMPAYLALMGGGIWVVATPPDEVTLPMLAVPGAPLAQLTRYAWGGADAAPDGGLIAVVAPAILFSLAIAAAAWWLAARHFRWEPRQ